MPIKMLRGGGCDDKRSAQTGIYCQETSILASASRTRRNMRMHVQCRSWRKRFIDEVLQAI
jgi:hypothetical protein